MANRLPTKSKKFRFAAALLVIAAAAGGGGWWWLNREPAIQYKSVPVVRTTLQSTIQATGTLNPVETVDVGTQISGTIEALYFDYNSEVKAGQLIALMDSATQEADVAQGEASLASAKAEVLNAQAALTVAEKNLRRTRELRDILQRAEHIVRPHDADEQRILAERAEERLRGDEAFPVRRDDSDPKSRLAKLLRRGVHRGVLDRGDEDMPPFPRRRSHAFERGVVRLGAARSEDYLGGVSSHELRHLVPRAAQHLLRLPSEGMHGIGVAEAAGKTVRNGTKRLFAKRRRGCVIEVYPFHGSEFRSGPARLP